MADPKENNSKQDQQENTPPVSPLGPTLDPVLTLTLRKSEVQMIVNHLTEGKWREVNNLIVKLQDQADPQLAPALPPKQVDKEKKDSAKEPTEKDK